MSLLDAYEDETVAAALAAPVVAPRKQDPAFSTWGMFRDLGRSALSGVSEQAGSTADILNAYGSVTAATGINAGGMFSTGTADQKKQRDAAAKKLAEQGPDYRSEAGALFRGVAKDYMPDPLTTHGAQLAVAEFGRVATKAITSAVVLGPLAGAAVAGAEEGFTAADKLADQGVDLGTRTAVGAVTGAVTGLGFALPVAGKTIAQTVGLAVAGGPASFMAQNAATREILQRADYSKLADQYDPFDPVGLTLSTLIPLGFGAVAMRAGARRAAGAPKAPEAVPEVAPIAPETVDAARVQLLRENVDAHRVTPVEDFAGAQAHETAVTRAIDQLAAGQRVEVAPMPEPVGAQIANTVAERLGPVAREVEALRQVEAVPAPVGEVVQGVTVGTKEGTAFLQAESAAGKVGGNVNEGALRITFAEVEEAMRGKGEGLKLYTALIDKALADGLRVFSDSTVEAPAVRVYEALKRRGYDVRRLEGGELEDGAVFGKGAKEPAFEVLAAPRAEPSRFDIDALARQAADLLINGQRPAEIIQRMQASGQAIAPELQNMLVAAAEFAGRIPELIQQFRALEARGNGSPIPNLIADAVDAMRASQPADAGRAAGNPLQSRLDEATMRNPDALDTRMPTGFDAEGKVSESVTAREFLDRVKAEADQEAADADLLQVAANCYLNVGA